MPSRRCSTCGVHFPSGEPYRICPICSGRTDYMGSGVADKDWRARVEMGTLVAEGSRIADARVVLNRLARFQAAGVELPEAILFASTRSSEGGFEVDVHSFERLLKSGCPLKVAVRIVRP